MLVKTFLQVDGITKVQFRTYSPTHYFPQHPSPTLEQPIYLILFSMLDGHSLTKGIKLINYNKRKYSNRNNFHEINKLKISNIT